jgi:hypothetical protein
MSEVTVTFDPDDAMSVLRALVHYVPVANLKAVGEALAQAKEMR